MHLYQPDWKSGVGTVDGRVDAGDYPDWTHVPDRWRSCEYANGITFRTLFYLVLHSVFIIFLTINIESGRMFDSSSGVVRATGVAATVLGSNGCQV